MGAKASTANGGQSPRGRTFSTSSSSEVVTSPTGFSLLRTLPGVTNDRQRARSLSSVPDLHASHEALAIPSTSYDVSSGASPETDSSSTEEAAGTSNANIALGKVYAASLPSHIWSLNREHRVQTILTPNGGTRIVITSVAEDNGVLNKNVIVENGEYILDYSNANTDFYAEGIKCPVCGKFVLPDDIECHLVMCLTKPRVSYNEDILADDKGECVICLEEMLRGDVIARLPCLCIYHKGCIDQWFEVNRVCPEHPGD